MGDDVHPLGAGGHQDLVHPRRDPRGGDGVGLARIEGPREELRGAPAVVDEARGHRVPLRSPAPPPVHEEDGIAARLLGFGRERERHGEERGESVLANAEHR
jgi:hypothetical protein